MGAYPCAVDRPEITPPPQRAAKHLERCCALEVAGLWMTSRCANANPRGPFLLRGEVWAQTLDPQGGKPNEWFILVAD